MHKSKVDSLTPTEARDKLKRCENEYLSLEHARLPPIQKAKRIQELTRSCEQLRAVIRKAETKEYGN